MAYMKAKAVDVDDLSVTLGKKVFAVKSLDVSLSEGEIVGIIGPSGAGKTTLIRSIVGRQKISNGRVWVFNRPAGSKKLRKQISYMTQEASVYPDLTVYENIDYFAKMYGLGKRARKHQIGILLATLDLKKLEYRLAGRLSGGQKQRVSLAIALIGSPKLIVLDEPTVGLDPVLREQIWQLFRELVAKGKTLIISSHVMEEAERCDDLVLLRDGMLLAHGSPAELCSRTDTKSVEQCFLQLVGGKK